MIVYRIAKNDTHCVRHYNLGKHNGVFRNLINYIGL